MPWFRRFIGPIGLLVVLAPGAIGPAHGQVGLGEAAGIRIDFEGLVQGDTIGFRDDLAALDHDRELRRAELVLKGSAPRWDWVVGYDVSERNDKWLDVNVRVRVGERWRWTIGQFKQPNSMEELTSTRANDFIAKAMVTGSLGVGRRLGTSVSRAGEHWDITGSWFGRELTSGGAEGAGYGLRASWTPVRGDAHIVHLGLSGIDHDAPGDTMRFRARPGMDLDSTPRLVDTGDLRDADRVRTLGLEAGWVTGPVKLQGEYMHSRTRRFGHDHFDGDSWYLSGVWNLSGESWGYRNAVFTTAKPSTSRGLWQLAARVEGIDLNDGAVRGGSETNFAVGVNWYWGEYAKLMLNYVRADASLPDGRSDRPSALAARVQLHW